MPIMLCLAAFEALSLCFIPTMCLLDSLLLMLHCTFLQTDAKDKEREKAAKISTSNPYGKLK